MGPQQRSTETTFFGDASFSACALAIDGFSVYAGDQNGRLHLLRLEDKAANIPCNGEKLPDTKPDPISQSGDFYRYKRSLRSTLYDARMLRRAGNSEGSISLLSSLAADSSSSPDSRREACLVLQEFGQTTEALQQLRGILAIQDLAPWQVIAAFDAILNITTEAIDTSAIWRIARSSEVDFGARVIAVSRLINAGAANDAYEVLVDLALDSTVDAEHRLWCAEKLASASHFDEAIFVLTSLVRSLPASHSRNVSRAAVNGMKAWLPPQDALPALRYLSHMRQENGEPNNHRQLVDLQRQICAAIDELSRDGAHVRQQDSDHAPEGLGNLGDSAQIGRDAKHTFDGDEVRFRDSLHEGQVMIASPSEDLLGETSPNALAAIQSIPPFAKLAGPLPPDIHQRCELAANALQYLVRQHSHQVLFQLATDRALNELTRLYACKALWQIGSAEEAKVGLLKILNDPAIEEALLTKALRDLKDFGFEGTLSGFAEDPDAPAGARLLAVKALDQERHRDVALRVGWTVSMNRVANASVRRNAAIELLRLGDTARGTVALLDIMRTDEIDAWDRISVAELAAEHGAREDAGTGLRALARDEHLRPACRIYAAETLADLGFVDEFEELILPLLGCEAINSALRIYGTRILIKSGCLDKVPEMGPNYLGGRETRQGRRVRVVCNTNNITHPPLCAQALSCRNNRLCSRTLDGAAEYGRHLRSLRATSRLQLSRVDGQWRCLVVWSCHRKL